jgi:hypothetical protein
MNSVADQFKSDLETRGEYVVKANAVSGWFAIFPQTWRVRTDRAISEGRDGPNLVVYRTKTADARDHFVIPHSVIRDLLSDATLTHSKVQGTHRWNMTLKNGQLHVTHATGSVDVAEYHGTRLIVEQDTPDLSDVVLPNQVPEGSIYPEGAVQRILVNRYERDARARAACVEHYGAICVVCGLDLGSVYGHMMDGFVHVHHLRLLSQAGPDYVIDPIADLRPVCPNCHAVIHQKVPPYSIDEVRSMLHRRVR